MYYIETESGHRQVSLPHVGRDRWRVRQTVKSQDGKQECDVSTVFLALDHDLSGKGPPVLYETMIFGGPRDDYQERYCTRAEAEAGHARAVATAFDEEAQ